MNKLLLGFFNACFFILCSFSTNAALVKAFQGTGTYGLEVAAVGIGALPTVQSPLDGSTLNLTAMPGGAITVKAYLYAYDINHFGTMSATFNGTVLGATGSYMNDSAFATLNTFRWDVTNFVNSSISNYSWSFSENQDVIGGQGASIGMAALAVVYSDPTLSTSIATIYDGMTYVGNTHPETESLSITGLSAGAD